MKTPDDHFGPLRGFIKTLLKSDSFFGLFLHGNHGIEKTTLTSSMLTESEISFVTLSNYATPLCFYNCLYENRDKVILLDNCKDIFEDPSVGIPLIKAALGPPEYALLAKAEGVENAEKRILRWKSTPKAAASEFEFIGKLIIISKKPPIPSLDGGVFRNHCFTYHIHLNKERRLERMAGATDEISVKGPNYMTLLEGSTPYESQKQFKKKLSPLILCKKGFEMETARYNFPVRATQIFTQINNEPVLLDGKRAIIREDTGTPIGFVGSNYQILKHGDAISLMKNALESLNESFELKVRLTHGGARAYAHFKLGGITATIGSAELGDVIQCEVVVKNSYDGFTSLEVEISALRLRCKNGLLISDRMFRLKRMHTRNLEIPDLSETVVNAITYFKTSVIPHLNRLTRVSLSAQEGLSFIDHSIEAMEFPRKYLDSVMARWVDTPERNLWGLLNCFTAEITHVIGPQSYQRFRFLSLAVDRYFRALSMKSNV